MTDVFISYAHEDHDYVRRMAPALEAEGFSVWWDHTIPPGKTWDEVIAKGIADARCCIVLWSKSSVVSDWVKEEATIAKDHRKFIPVQIDDSEPPVGFRRIQAAHLQNWNGNVGDPQWQMLSREIRSVVSASRASGAGSASPSGGAQAYAPRAYQPPPSYNDPTPQRSGPPPLAIGIMGVAALVAVIAVVMAVMPSGDAPTPAPAPIEQPKQAAITPPPAPPPAQNAEVERLRQERDDALRRAEEERLAREAEVQRLRRERDRLEQQARAEAQQTSMVGTWAGNYNGWRATWTFRANGTFSHSLEEGVSEECRHGTYRVTGTQLRMEYNACDRLILTGTVSNGSFNGFDRQDRPLSLTRR